MPAIEGTMTKTEMLEALAQGHKVTHIYFTDEEWMKEGSTLDIEFEDGCQCSSAQFWKCHQEESFLSGWSIYKD